MMQSEKWVILEGKVVPILKLERLAREELDLCRERYEIWKARDISPVRDSLLKSWLKRLVKAEERWVLTYNSKWFDEAQPPPLRVKLPSTDVDEFSELELIPAYFFEENDYSSVVAIPAFFFAEEEEVTTEFDVSNPSYFFETYKCLKEWFVIGCKWIGKDRSTLIFGYNRKLFDCGKGTDCGYQLEFWSKHSSVPFCGISADFLVERKLLEEMSSRTINFTFLLIAGMFLLGVSVGGFLLWFLGDKVGTANIKEWSWEHWYWSKIGYGNFIASMLVFDSVSHTVWMRSDEILHKTEFVNIGCLLELVMEDSAVLVLGFFSVIILLRLIMQSLHYNLVFFFTFCYCFMVILWGVLVVLIRSLQAYVDYEIGSGNDDSGQLLIKKSEGIKGRWHDGGSIAFAVILVIIVTAVSDYRQFLQFQSLNDEKRNIHMEVIRGGKRIEVSIFDLVVGDVVPLKLGDQVPMGGVLKSGHSLAVEESSMTGESKIVQKDRKHPFMMSGCKVADGYGTMLVTGVGINIEWGLLMASISEDNGEETPLQLRLNGIATFVGIVGLVVALFVLLVLLVRYFTGHSRLNPYVKGKTSVSDAIDGVIKIVTVMVTIVVITVPEGLPFVVTLTPAYSMRKMMVDKAWVRRLSACETINSVTTICSDKTGSVCTSESGKVENSWSPTEKVILSWGVKLEMNFEELKSQCQLLHVFPFNSEKKREGLALQLPVSHVHIHWKGTTELVLSSRTEYLATDGSCKILDESMVKYFKGAISEMAANSLRCVALAYISYGIEKVPKDKNSSAEWVISEDELVLLAIVGIQDPCRPGVREAIELCTKAGVKVCMVTGDREFSSAKIGLMVAQFEIRQKNLMAARKILGNAIGVAPKDKIFKKYIEIELQLGNMDRCRTLYAKYLHWSPGNCYAWIKFAELEISLGETERTRMIFERATEQQHLDTVLVHPSMIERLDSVAEDVIEQKTWIDCFSVLPSFVGSQNASKLLSLCPSSGDIEIGIATGSSLLNIGELSLTISDNCSEGRNECVFRIKTIASSIRMFESMIKCFISMSVRLRKDCNLVLGWDLTRVFTENDDFLWQLKGNFLAVLRVDGELYKSFYIDKGSYLHTLYYSHSGSEALRQLQHHASITKGLTTSALSLMYAWKIGPTLATGNTVVMKPADLIPLSALYVSILLHEAGLLPGVVNIISGFRETVGAGIESHMDVDKTAFTGSTATGQTILEWSAKSNLKQATLELGGRSPFIVFDDANIDESVNTAHLAVLRGDDSSVSPTAMSQLVLKQLLHCLVDTVNNTYCSDFSYCWLGYCSFPHP